MENGAPPWIGRSRAWIASLLAATALPAVAAPRPILLDVDTRDIAHGIQHAHETLPASPGEMGVVYPKWIQGEHSAAGPVVQVTGLKFTAGGSTLEWTRDPLDAFRFRVGVPDGVSTIEADFDYLSPPVEFANSYGGTPNVTPHMALVVFNHVLLLPDGADIRRQTVRAKVHIPTGWNYDTAERGAQPQPGLVELPEMTAATLVDSPLFAGEYARTIELTTQAPPTRISIFADASADLAIEDADVAALRRVVAEATALFGVHHYRRYVWLTALGDTLAINGLEHHESTDIRMKEALFTKPEFMQRWADVFPHEYFHSWNGKYRRPAGLVHPDFQQPLQDNLLWVYEGLTRYYGEFVLRGRARFDPPGFILDYLADSAATQEYLRPGRTWRPLADTAVGVPAYSSAPGEWSSERRPFDYYPEGALIWLEADTIIRTRSHGRRSLDDFCRRFFGGEEGSTDVRAYTREDVVAALDAVEPYDWDAFLRTRVDDVQPHAPLGGIVNGGWKLTRSDVPNPFVDATAKVSETDTFAYSLGLYAKADGKVADVVYGSPAFEAGLAPATKLIAIGGRKWSAQAAKEIIVAAEKTGTPIDLIVESGDTVRTLHVDWHGGLAWPHLTRDRAKPDLISRILAPEARN